MNCVCVCVCVWGGRRVLGFPLPDWCSALRRFTRYCTYPRRLRNENLPQIPTFAGLISLLVDLGEHFIGLI
jgi:hypothetical protein